MLLSVSLMDTNSVQAGFADNYSRLYYDIAAQAYKVGEKTDKEIENYINDRHGDKKFKVIASVDVNSNPDHPMGKPVYNLKKTGFKALAVVKEPVNDTDKGKVFVAFAGTQPSLNLSDHKNALVSVEGDNTPGQNYQAHLFLNWLYVQNYNYQKYDWYFTGHSLGGWLASKSYLDVRSAKALVTDPAYTNRGPIKKSKISGVYTFNALPIAKRQISSTQWSANLQGTYNTDVKNLFVDNEWLNSIYDMHPTEINYIGFKGAVDVQKTKLPHYTDRNYRVHGLTQDIGDYYLMNVFHDITEYHGISYLKGHTFY